MNAQEKIDFTMTFWGWRFFPLDNRGKLNRKLVQSFFSSGNVRGLIEYVNGVYDNWVKNETEQILNEIQSRYEEERSLYLKAAKLIIEKSDQPKKDLRELASLFQHYELINEINETFKAKKPKHETAQRDRVKYPWDIDN